MAYSIRLVFMNWTRRVSHVAYMLLNGSTPFLMYIPSIILQTLPKLSNHHSLLWKFSSISDIFMLVRLQSSLDRMFVRSQLSSLTNLLFLSALALLYSGECQPFQLLLVQFLWMFSFEKKSELSA